MTAEAKQAPRPATGPLFLPLGAAVLLAAFGWLPQIRLSSGLATSVTGASLLLMGWWLLLWFRGRPARVELVLRPSHYMQTFTQLAIFVYWAMYWPPMQHAASLIAVQVVFAYAFDMLLTWTRRERYVAGFGPFPIVFSINLFLRFHDEWFSLQFAVLAAGFLAKELIRWNKDGQSAHIFNPSSFPLAITSLVLLLTGATGLTWGEDLALQLFRPPQIFLFIFLVSLPGQFRFGVTTMSLAAVLTTYGFGLAFLAVTGTYFFVDDYIPIAVFLGMLLLFTDPSTAPKTELGRIIFGVIYGASVVGLYALLERMGLPTFYDKLLQVPVMNVMVRMIDRWARSPQLAWLDPARIGRSLRPVRRNLAYTSLWVVVFTAMAAAGGLSDHHPGHSVRFWQQACDTGRAGGCRVLGKIETRYCSEGSPWACNEVGLLMSERKLDDNTHAIDAFKRACALGSASGCDNARIQLPGHFRREDPTPQDYALLLREGKGPLLETTPELLLALACRQGWPSACAPAATAAAAATTPPERAAAFLQQVCDRGSASGCATLGFMYDRGEGVARDPARARILLTHACELSVADACARIAELDRGR